MTNGQKIRHEEPIYIRENNRGSNDDENFATMSMYNWERMKRRARWKYNNRNEKFVDRIHSFVFFFFFFFFFYVNISFVGSLTLPLLLVPLKKCVLIPRLYSNVHIFTSDYKYIYIYIYIYSFMITTITYESLFFPCSRGMLNTYEDRKPCLRGIRTKER